MAAPDGAPAGLVRLDVGPHQRLPGKPIVRSPTVTQDAKQGMAPMAKRRPCRNLGGVVTAAIALFCGQLVLGGVPAQASTQPLSIAALPNYDPEVQGEGPLSSIPVSGGKAPYTFRLVDGQMPPGLTLSANGEARWSGDDRGSYQITVRVTDASGDHATQRVTIPVLTEHCVSQTDQQCTGGGAHQSADINDMSADGSWVLLATSDQSLYPSAPPGQILIRDRPSGALSLASSDASGTPSPGGSTTGGEMAISANGRYVFFASDTWEADGTNTGCWVKDTVTGTLSLVQANTPSTSSTFCPVAVSDDGTVAVARLPSSHEFAVYDLANGTGVTPAVCAGDTTEPYALTPDGRYVLFYEVTSAPCSAQIGGTTVLLDRTTNSLSTIAFAGDTSQAGISDDGRYVGYWSDQQPGYPPGDFMLDRTTGNVTPMPGPPAGVTTYPSGTGAEVSADGSQLAAAYSGAECIIHLPSQAQSCIDVLGFDDGFSLSEDFNTLLGADQFSGPEEINAFDIPPINGNTTTQRYVALGDSYSSGEGNPPFNPTTPHCDQSQHDAWPELVAQKPLLLRGLLACSGATTSALTQSFKNQPPQLDQLRRLKPNVVTITIGGNDIGFESVIENCAEVDCATNGIIGQAETAIQNFQPAAEDAYAAIKAEAPGVAISSCRLSTPFPRIR